MTNLPKESHKSGVSSSRRHQTTNVGRRGRFHSSLPSEDISRSSVPLVRGGSHCLAQTRALQQISVGLSTFIKNKIFTG